MESNNVRVLSPATFTADLHRRVCEWEVRCSLRAVATTLTFFSLSGRDACDTIDAAHLYHEHDYRALPHSLQIAQDGYEHDQFAYASHSGSGVPLSGKRIALSILFSIVDTIYVPCNSCTSRSLRSLPVVSLPRSWVAWLSITTFFAKLRALHVTNPACSNTSTCQHRQVAVKRCTSYAGRVTAETR